MLHQTTFGRCGGGNIVPCTDFLVARRHKTGRVVIAICVWYISPPPSFCAIDVRKKEETKKSKTKKQLKHRFRF